MTMIRSMMLILTLLVPSAAFAAGEEEIIETITLQPKQKREVSVASAEKVKLGWKHTDGSAASKCKKMCVMMTKQGAVDGMASMHGMSIGIVPIDGKVSATLENVEEFPIEIEIFTKAAAR
jgi:hypothetical protein